MEANFWEGIRNMTERTACDISSDLADCRRTKERLDRMMPHINALATAIREFFKNMPMEDFVCDMQDGHGTAVIPTIKNLSKVFNDCVDFRRAAPQLIEKMTRLENELANSTPNAEKDLSN